MLGGKKVPQKFTNGTSRDLNFWDVILGAQSETLYQNPASLFRKNENKANIDYFHLYYDVGTQKVAIDSRAAQV